VANAVHQFKHRDVQRTVRAARQMGIDVNAVTVKLPNGTEITATDNRQPGEVTANGNPWDRVTEKKQLAHAADKKRTA
jgi:hypothetical protein